jgi:hypothetical protein
MSDTPAFLAERLISEGKKTLEFFKALQPEEWRATIYTEGTEWAVRDVLAHFVAAEKGVTRLIEVIVAGGSGVPEDFDLNAYNERKVSSLKETPPEALLEQFIQARQQSAKMAGGLSPQDLEKIGRHPFLGLAPVAEILKLVYRHNQLHQRDVRRSLHPDSENAIG